jgi:hypothetical protein
LKCGHYGGGACGVSKSVRRDEVGDFWHS